MTTSKKTNQMSTNVRNGKNKMESINSPTVNGPIRIERALEQLSWLRSFAGQCIDSDTAEVRREYSFFLDPYGVTQHKSQKPMAHYFARPPGSDIWVAWEDLPYEVEWRLWQKHKQTDPMLREPTSCWAAFVNSQYFRPEEETPAMNRYRYMRQRTVDKLEGE
jgi:hypothetical protein